jgi:hypothetical protein
MRICATAYDPFPPPLDSRFRGNVNGDLLDSRSPLACRRAYDAALVRQAHHERLLETTFKHLFAPAPYQPLYLKGLEGLFAHQ